MIFLAAPQYDPNGTVLLRRTTRSDFGEVTRRGGRTATLDGAAVLVDLGYSVADRTFRIVAERETRETYSTISYLVRIYGSVVLCCAEGVFYGAIRDLGADQGGIRFTFYALEDLG